MRSANPAYRAALTSAHGVWCRVSSWRSGKVLAADVPVTDGTITYDDTALLRRRITLTVPTYDPVTRRSWDPADDAGAPLATYGQRLNVQVGIVLPTGVRQPFQHGWYLITSWQLSEDERTIAVTGADLSQLLADARHYRTETPASGATYRTEFARLADGILPTRVSGALPTRRINAATVWERERTTNLDDLCDAWNARWRVADDGVLEAVPEYATVTASTKPDLILQGGVAGTVVDRTRTANRERLYNAVIVNGKTDSTTESAPYGKAEVTAASSPIRVNGPYGRKPRFYQSDLLTTNAQCATTAKSLLPAATSVSRSEPIICVPDPAMELGDVLQVRTGGTRFTGRVSSISLPVTAEGGAMTVTISNEPNADDEGE